jgi:hypothetical protein
MVLGRDVYPHPRLTTLSLAWVDQDGQVLDTLVQSQRNAKAAKCCFRRLLSWLQYVPRMTSADPTTRAENATFQIPKAVTAFRIHPQPDPYLLSTPSPSYRCQGRPSRS